MIFFTSDTHYMHKNIIKYSNRPFNNTYEMEQDMIEKWNGRVGKDDLVFHLGDFAFCGGWFLSNIISKLNGNLILIKGNHDKASKLLNAGIKFVYPEAYITIDNKVFHLNHYPPTSMGRNGEVIFPRPRSIMKTDYELHGHSHSPAERKLRVYQDKKYLDVGVDGNNFYPYTYKEVMDLMDG